VFILDLETGVCLLELADFDERRWEGSDLLIGQSEDGL
jgi:hypothetical protein